MRDAPTSPMCFSHTTPSSLEKHQSRKQSTLAQ
ncbi:hypothetical protein LINGRAHAP2_LOCUS22345 [Linum grandiflorum]